MTSIDRTAYPEFKRNHIVRELVALYTVTDHELEFVLKNARTPPARLTLAVLLKSFQRLHYFPLLEDVPSAVVRHVRASLKFRRQIALTDPTQITLYRYHRLIRDYASYRAFGKDGLDVAARAIYDAAQWA